MAMADAVLTSPHPLSFKPIAMSQPPELTPSPTLRARLVEAARQCFLADDYHAVTTRQIAEQAGANVSMIRYYFGNKEGLYEEMIRETLQPLLDVLDGPLLDSLSGFSDYLALYYRTMTGQPEFPRLILKVLALRHGPGRRFIQALLERGRSRAGQRLARLAGAGQVSPDVDPDVVRMGFVSLAMTPILLKEIFETQMGRPMDEDFLTRLAQFNGHLLAAGLASPPPSFSSPSPSSESPQP